MISDCPLSDQSSQASSQADWSVTPLPTPFEHYGLSDGETERSALDAAAADLAAEGAI